MVIFATKKTVSSLLPQIIVGLTLGLSLVGCGATKSVAKKEKPLPTTATSEVSASGPVIADGVSTSTISIVIRDQNGSAMPGLSPVVTVTGAGNNISACSVTAADGSSTCTLTSTVAEDKSINLSQPVAVPGVSVSFVPGPASKLAFSTQPSEGTAGQVLVVQPVVQVQDAYGNRVTSASNAVTLSLASGSTGSISGTVSLNAIAGLASFSGLSFTTDGNKVLTAVATGLTAASSNSFSVAVDSGDQLSFLTQPGGGVAGAVWSQQPVVRILDSGGNLKSGATNAVTLTMTSGTGALLGTQTVNAVGGVATFSGLNIQAVGNKVLTATAATMANAVSNSFTIVPGAPDMISFQSQPGGGLADAVWSQQPVVQLFDVYGNLCTNSSASVVLSVQSGSGSLVGTSTINAVSGVATFTDLKMTVAGSKVLRATVNGLTLDSNAFEISSGAATQMVYVTQPSGGVAGSVWSTQPALEVRDAFSNRVVTFAGTVAVSLTAGSGSLSGTLSQTATGGVVVFSGLKMNEAGTGKIITASSAGLTPLASNAFAITHAAASQLVLTTQPSDDLANTVLSSQPVVELRDSYGNKVTSGFDASAPVVASLQSGGGVLLGTGTIAASAGVATFVDLKLSTPGEKVLRISKPNTTSFGGSGSIAINSLAFDALVGAPAQVEFVTSPTGSVAGVVWPTQPVVEIKDSAGNLVTTSTATVLMALQSGTGSLLGTASIAAVAGRATFTNLKINEAGAKTLRASSAGLSDDDSASFSILHAAASKLAVTTAPGGGIYDQVWATQPVVEIQDTFNNRVTTGADASTFISASLQSGSGSLGGTTSLTATSGVVSFTNLQIDEVGAKTLRFSKDDTSGTGGTTAKTVDSGSFQILAGTPTQLAVVTQPGAGVAGQNFAVQPVIEILDAAGNRVTSSTAAVTVALDAGSTGSLIGTATVNAVAGVATFTNLRINITGSKILNFSAAGLTGIASSAFAVTAGLASSLEVLTPVSGAVVDQAFIQQPVLQIKDAFGNIVETGVDASANVTASLFSGTGLLSGSLTVPASAGVVTFTNLQLSAIGSKVLRFTKVNNSGSGGASALLVNSASFSVVPGAGVDLAFATQPGGGVAGSAWAQQPVVEVRDAAGNVDTTSTVAVTLALGTGSGTLSGTVTVNAVAGVASFSGLSLDAIGTNKVLSATAAGLNAVNSAAFTITAGVAVAGSDILISSGPKWSNGSDAYTVTVTALDSFGNPAAGRTVTLSSSRAGFDTISGSPATTDVNGDAIFQISSNTGGTSILTATINPGSVTVSTTPSAVFADFKVAAAQSSWNQDRVGLAADGVALLTLSGTLRNAAGTVLPSKSISLTSSRGGSDILSASSTLTNASGEFSFTVRSALTGIANLTLSVPTDAVNVTTSARAHFLAVSPYSEYVPSFATLGTNHPQPGQNSPAVSSWLDMASGGTADGALLSFAYNTSSSGWMGDGGTTISGGTSGPYRLGFDGTGDAVDLGTSFNSATSLTVEAWARPGNMALGGRVILGNADGSRGLVVRSAKDGSSRLEGLMASAGTLGLSYAEIVMADSPAGYWRLNESVGTTANPTSGVTAGTYSASGVTYGVLGAHLNNDRAIALNGTNGFINMGNVYNSTGHYTFEAWVYLTSPVSTNSRSVVAKAATNNGLALEVNTSQRATFTAFNGTTAVVATGTTAFSTNTWYHVVGVRNVSLDCSAAAGKSTRIYVNGVQEACTSFYGTVNANSSNLRVGEHSVTAGRRFPGRIDEVALYSGNALSLARIQAHYAGRLKETCYSAAAIPNSVWSHFMFGYDSVSQALRMQVNGSETCNVTTSGLTLNGSTYRFGLGALVNGSGSVVSATEWLGELGDVRFYNQGINSTEAGLNYSAQSGRYP